MVESDDTLAPYVVARYPSEGEYMGLTIKGKRKPYIDSHVELKSMLIQGEEIITCHGKFKINELKKHGSMLTTIVHIESENGVKGKAELKVYAPSKSKNKGATIEIRKLSGDDFSNVESLREMILSILDDLLKKKNSSDIPVISSIKSNPKPFKCNHCDWESRFASHLKKHMERFHADSVSKFSSINVSKKRQKDEIDCNKCDTVFKSNVDLSEHMNKIHGNSDVSPSSSPPKKKLEIDHDTESLDKQAPTLLEELQKRIEDLENSVAAIVQNKQVTETEKHKMMLRNKKFANILLQLTPVKDCLLPNLRGFKSIFKVAGDGRCLQNCLAVHGFGDPSLGIRIKHMVNNHIAEFWDYYKNKVHLPFEEKVGVGKDSKTIVIETDEQMLLFLRSDEALKVYSNFLDLLGLANMFKVNIHVFTFDKEDQSHWNYISPDYSMFQSENKRRIPDMFLYHSKDDHYDLLIDDIILDDIASIEKTDLESHTDMVPIERRPEIKNIENIDKASINDVGEQIVIPQVQIESMSNITKFTCKKCDSSFEKQDKLEEHMKSHETFVFTTPADTFDKQKDDWICGDCDFQTNEASILMKHLKDKGHQPSSSIKDKRLFFKDYRQCYTCKLEFDGYWRLMEHRKNEHPSNKKCRNFPGKCTFKNDCWYVHEEALMEIDESFKDEKVLQSFKCNYCEEQYEVKSEFMRHKKEKHRSNVDKCEKHLKNICIRNDSTCWFIHEQVGDEVSQKQQENSVSQTPQDFQQVHPKHLPPELIISKLVDSMEALSQNILKMDQRLKHINQ